MNRQLEQAAYANQMAYKLFVGSEKVAMSPNDVVLMDCESDFFISTWLGLDNKSVQLLEACFHLLQECSFQIRDLHAAVILSCPHLSSFELMTLRFMCCADNHTPLVEFRMACFTWPRIVKEDFKSGFQLLFVSGEDRVCQAYRIQC